MNDELLYLIPTLLLGLTMAFEIVWVWSARGTVERSIENLDDRIERLVEMEYTGPECKLPRFKVGDVVIGNEKAKQYYTITKTGFLGIITAIEDDGLMVIKCLKYPDLSYTVKQECFDLFGEQQTVDIPETEKPESIMERWANESKNFSETLKNLLKEFGFASTCQVKYQILSAFSEKYIKLFGKLGTNSCDPDDISVIRLAKALLVVSTYLETDNIEEVIDWADRN